jgi:aryl-alcohol dehydrogenase-like predicted oxidoreductase
MLGSSGVAVSYLAIGTGTKGISHSSDQTRKDPRWLTDAFVRAYDLGINFWDLADLYGSHPFAEKALKEFTRGQIAIMTKTMATNYAACKADVERFLGELGTDYLDIVLLHCKTSRNWNRDQTGAMEALSEAQERGLIRAVGISAHSYSALETAVEEPWVEIMLVRYNYNRVQMDGSPEKIANIMSRAKDKGKGIIAMKVLGEGALNQDPEKAIRFVVDTPCVDSMTIGYLSDEEMSQCADIVATARKSLS